MIKMVNQRLRERPSGLRDFFDVARHGSPRRSLGFQQAACFQLGERALHGVGVDLRLRGEVAHAGDFFARRVFADDDGQLQLFNELEIDGTTGDNGPFHDEAPFLYCCTKGLIQ